MSDVDEQQDVGPVANEPFAKVITWRVFNEHIFPKRLGGGTVIAGGVATGDFSYVIPAHETLSLYASIKGRERFQDLAVTRALLEDVSPSRTFQTKSNQYLRRLILWGLLWAIAFGLEWPAVASLTILAIIPLFMAICFAPPPLSRAVVDFAWWSGRGFRSEARTRWILAIALWLLDAGTLAFLQIRVL
jgi:hypothetical protein